MKIAEGFVLRKIIDEWVVVPIGNKASCMLYLNESSALLWETLENDCDEDALVDALCSKYIVEKATALSDVRSFIAKLEEMGALLHD